jgi:phospholipid/cholesterol/gamma-HCH transport system permease protein
LFEFLKSPVFTFQEFIVLAGRTIRGVFRKPYYWNDVFVQMDLIGIGSLPVVLLTGFFSGAVMALQMSRALQTYGATSQVGQIVAITLVREMGPVLTALMVAGRNASGMASELGSMKVTEQIDAMRALGTDPVMKLVKPRVLATSVVLPLLTILADFVGIVGGWLVACVLLSLTTTEQYWNNSWRALEYNDITQGLLKPFVFALVLSLVGCYYGMRTTGGTQGVGRSTTQAVVVASVWVVVLTFIIGRVFVSM